MSSISANLTSPPDNFSTTLSSGISSSDLSIPLNSVAGLATEGVGVIFTKDTNGDVTAGSVEIVHWTGIGGSSLTLTNVADRGLTGSDSGAQAYSAGAYFEVWVTSYYYKSLRDGIVALDMGTLVHGYTSKATPVDADEIGLWDSAASGMKKLTWANLKATLRTYFLPRTNTVTSSATPSIDTDTTDIFTITALATTITSMTTNLTGTPINGQKLTIRILDNGTARAITWGTSFASRGATLPTTTVLSKYMYVGFIYNSTAGKWDCVALSQEV